MQYETSAIINACAVCTVLISGEYFTSALLTIFISLVAPVQNIVQKLSYVKDWMPR